MVRPITNARRFVWSPYELLTNNQPLALHVHIAINFTEGGLEPPPPIRGL